MVAILEHLILFPRSAGTPIYLSLQAVHLYEDTTNGASLLISRTNSTFSVRGVLGPDRAIRPRPDRAAPANSGDQSGDHTTEIDPKIPTHWVTIAKHALPGTDYQVNKSQARQEEKSLY